jgi:uncharacterized protein (TIGR03067 family)
MAQNRFSRALCGAALPLVVSLCAGPSPGAEGRKADSDQELIQGTWECVATLQDGKQVNRYVGVRAIMRGDRLTWVFPQPGGKRQVVKAGFRLDPGQNPKHFDWFPEARPTEVHKRLYVLGDGVLLWSTNLGAEARPGSFTAGRWQFVMKRVAGQE